MSAADRGYHNHGGISAGSWTGGMSAGSRTAGTFEGSWTTGIAAGNSTVGMSLGSWTLGNAVLHPLTLVYAVSGSAMISTIRVPKI